MQHRKKTVLAVEMLAVLREAVPDRDLVVVGDNGYANREVLTVLPARTCFIGRGVMDAAVYERPGKRRPGMRGRKPVKGARSDKLGDAQRGSELDAQQLDAGESLGAAEATRSAPWEMPVRQAAAHCPGDRADNRMISRLERRART